MHLRNEKDFLFISEPLDHNNQPLKIKQTLTKARVQKMNQHMKKLSILPLVTRN
jgi:hypothetical protein